MSRFYLEHSKMVFTEQEDGSVVRWEIVFYNDKTGKIERGYAFEKIPIAPIEDIVVDDQTEEIDIPVEEVKNE